MQEKECHVPGCNLNEDQLEQYRKTWTTDNSFSRHLRFQTESRRSANSGLPENFQVVSVRYLPGTPKPVEHFRERLLERFGILGVTVMRYYIGPSMISWKTLRNIINTKLEIKMKQAELNQVNCFVAVVCNDLTR